MFKSILCAGFLLVSANVLSAEQQNTISINTNCYNAQEFANELGEFNILIKEPATSDNGSVIIDYIVTSRKTNSMYVLRESPRLNKICVLSIFKKANV